jgi:hypothetical protein
LFGQGIAVLRFVRLSLAAEVGSVNPEAGGEQRHQAIEASAGFAPRMEQPYWLRALVALHEARHRETGAEPQSPDFGFHSLRVRRARPGVYGRLPAARPTASGMLGPGRRGLRLRGRRGDQLRDKGRRQPLLVALR